MGRGKKDLAKVRRIVTKLLNGVPIKQIAYEEDLFINERSQSSRRIVWIKKKYISVTKVLRLNKKGLLLMNEDQLKLDLKRKPLYRVDHRLKSYKRGSRARRRPRNLV